MFPTKTRVTGFAVSQDIGTMLAAFLPELYATVAPSGTDVPLIVGTSTFGIGIIAAVAAFPARETHRVHLHDLGNENATEVPREEYDRIPASLSSTHLRATAAGSTSVGPAAVRRVSRPAAPGRRTAGPGRRRGGAPRWRA